MAQPTTVGYRPTDVVPDAVYRAAARRVTRTLVPASLLLLALAVIEAVTTGHLLPLQLASAAVLVATLPGALIATTCLARLTVDGTIRRMDRELRASAAPRT